MQGLLKVFRLPKSRLQPESWVPASVASYQTLSWDLDHAFIALNELANMFQPGIINVIEQQLVGPNGGEPLNFKQDLFDPLGDRITIISDFKKPIKEDSERMLLAVALEDTKAFQNSLNKLIELAGAAPKKREFQNTTIYDFEVPVPIPNAPTAATRKRRSGGRSAWPSPRTRSSCRASRPCSSWCSVAAAPAWPTARRTRRLPGKSPEGQQHDLVRPDEQARLTYDMIKSGQFEQALLQGMAVGRAAPTSSCPRSSPGEDARLLGLRQVLSQGGRYSDSAEDGLMSTFTLRENNPSANPVLSSLTAGGGSKQLKRSKHPANYHSMRRALIPPACRFSLGEETRTDFFSAAASQDQETRWKLASRCACMSQLWPFPGTRSLGAVRTESFRFFLRVPVAWDAGERFIFSVFSFGNS